MGVGPASNEAIDSNNNSYFIQLNTYASQINAASAKPAPALPWWGLVALPALILLVVSRALPRKALTCHR